MDAYLRKGGWLKFGQVDICNYRLLKQSMWGGWWGGGVREGIYAFLPGQRWLAADRTLHSGGY